MKTIMAIISFIVQIWNKLHPKKSLEQNLAEEKVKQIKRDDEQFNRLVFEALKDTKEIDKKYVKDKKQHEEAVKSHYSDKLSHTYWLLYDTEKERTKRLAKFGENVLCNFGYTGPDEG